MDTRTKFKQFSKKLHDSTSFQYKVFIIAFVVIMLIFGTSKLYLPVPSNIVATEIGEQKKASSITTLSLYSWKFNPESQIMEVVMLINNSDNNFHLNFTATAVKSNDKTHRLNSEIKYSSSQTLIVTLDKIKPNSFDGIKVSVTEQEDEKMSLSSSSKSSSSQITTNSKTYSADFICTKQSVQQDSTLSIKTESQYKQLELETQIKSAEKELSDLQNNNEKLQKQVKELEEDIATLETQKTYQSDEDKKKTTSNQNSKQMQINRANTEINTNKKSVDALIQKIEKYKEHLNDLQKISN